MADRLKDWNPIPSDYDALKAGSIDGTDTEPHDRAVIRAMAAEYLPNRDVVGDPKKTLFVARLNPKTNEETIYKAFSRYGDVVRCRLVRDIVTGFSKCYAFVEFASKRDAADAHREAYKMALEGHEMLVDYECERSMSGWVPRRMGGGLGGRKESGQLRFGGRDRPFRKPIIVATRGNWKGQQHGRVQGHRGPWTSSRDDRGHSASESPRGDYGRQHQHGHRDDTRGYDTRDRR